MLASEDVETESQQRGDCPAGSGRCLEGYDREKRRLGKDTPHDRWNLTLPHQKGEFPSEDIKMNPLWRCDGLKQGLWTQQVRVLPTKMKGCLPANRLCPET